MTTKVFYFIIFFSLFLSLKVFAGKTPKAVTELVQVVVDSDFSDGELPVAEPYLFYKGGPPARLWLRCRKCFILSAIWAGGLGAFVIPLALHSEGYI